MPNDKYRQRLDELFATIEQLETNPESHLPAIRCELDELRARLTELETTFLEAQQQNSSNESAGNAQTRRAVPILYETERVGYAFADDKVQMINEQGLGLQVAQELMIAPLIAGEQSIGEIQLRSSTERQWTPEETQLANTVAQQASLQIQNLRLLEATERARAEAEAASRQFMYEGWESFMDGIHTDERIGYAYDQSAVKPHIDRPGGVEGGYEESVAVMDEQVGTLFLKPDPSRPFTPEDKTLIASIANRVAQQVENIRLLADAARARAQAEEATRLLTHEAWEVYLRQNNELSYAYDSIRVRQIDPAQINEDPVLMQPLKVRGETIGQLAIAGCDNVSPEDASLSAAIAEQVSAHLERLRLTEQNEKRAAQLATVATVSTTASNMLDPDSLLQMVVDLTKERFALYHAHIYLADDAWQTLLLAAGAGEVGRAMVADNWSIPLNHASSIVAGAAQNKNFIIANDVRRDKDSGFLSHRLLPDTRSEMAVPMIVGEKVLGVFDVQSDVADHFTEEDANIYTTLATQVAIALQNARLYVEQAATVTQLRELDRLKSSFLANMSHELRTPLNSILGFTDVMLEGLDGNLTDYMDNDLHLIQKNGQHLLHLINDVLDMAKIESGRMNLNPETFKVQSALEEVTSITSTLASEKNLSLFIEENSDQEIVIYADNTRLRQVMINLVNNAIKFTQTGRISICAKPMEGARVLITVKDTGIGIPPDKLEAIFQEFTQVDSSTTRKAGGTGLGLPISRRLVEMHGGRLWAESTGIEGEGSIFYVELPVEARISEVIEKQEK
jgi:signal transduction histidine kinase